MNHLWSYEGPHPQGRELILGKEKMNLTFPSDTTNSDGKYSDYELAVRGDMKNGEFTHHVGVVSGPKIEFKGKCVLDWGEPLCEVFKKDGSLQFWVLAQHTKPCSQSFEELRSKQTEFEETEDLSSRV